MKQFEVAGHEASLLPDGDWKLVWADEFDGAKGDKPDPKKWMYRTKFWGHKSNTYIGDEGVETDGNSNLIFKLIEKDGQYYSTQLQTGTNAFDYLIRGGTSDANPWGQTPFWPLEQLPEPTFMHRYGYYEVRCKLQDQRGWWSAFWLQSPSIGTTKDGRYSGIECDIFECFHGHVKQATSGLFRGGYAAECESMARVKYFPEDVSRDAYHRFGVEWDESGYTFYCDGKQTVRYTDAVSHIEQFILLTTECEGYRSGGLAQPSELLKKAVLPDAFTVDYVRVFDRMPKK